MAGGERDRLDQVFLDHLAQEGECLAWHRLWPEYDQLSLTVETLLRSCHHWLQSHPSIYVRSLEQSYSVTMLREKVALQDMMRADDTEDVVDMMSTLSCSTDQIQVTPDISRKATSRAGNEWFLEYFRIVLHCNLFTSSHSKEGSSAISRDRRPGQTGQEAGGSFEYRGHSVPTVTSEGEETRSASKGPPRTRSAITGDQEIYDIETLRLRFISSNRFL